MFTHCLKGGLDGKCNPDENHPVIPGVPRNLMPFGNKKKISRYIGNDGHIYP